MISDRGKPFFRIPSDVVTRFPNWNYNVSHHGDYVGIATEPVCLVGLDIMNSSERPRTNARSFDFFKVIIWSPCFDWRVTFAPDD